MKTFTNILTTLITISLIFISNNSNAQQGSIWGTIDNNSNVPVLLNNRLFSNDAAFNQAIIDLNIISVNKALPASRNQNLQNVYEITCACNVEDLYATLANSISAVTGETYAPVYQTLDTPNDYLVTFANDYALDLIQAENAWDLTHGDSNLIIAISDQNYYQHHEELVGKITYYDSTNTSTQTHGTAVAILAAGNTNNGIGKSSIGYNSKLALYRMNYNDAILASYAGAKVINLSWTSGCSFNQYAQDAINEIYNNGTFIVAAAGNGTTCGGADNLVYPASFENVFAVTSVGPNNNHERTIGNPSTTHQHNYKVDLSAPGYDVAISSAPGWYLTNSGTSFASPLVSGTVALMLAANPCLTQSNIEFILKASSTNIDSLNPLYAGKIGTGRLNAAAAVQMAQNWQIIRVEATTTTTCVANGGQIELTLNGTAPFQAVWSNGETGLIIDSLYGGEYSVTVTDAMGCTTDTTIYVDTVVPITIEANVTNVSCNGLTNGSIDLSITEGNVMNIWWDFDNMNTEDLENLSAGIYKVKITNDKGCSTFQSFTITEPTLLTATIQATQYSEGQQTALDLTIQGGTELYNVIWNNNVYEEDQINIAAGYYVATITDANGCQTTAEATIDAYDGIGEEIAGISDQELNLTVYPNPTSENATVKWEGTAEKLQILNSAGQLVLDETVENTNQFSVQNMNSGIYYIQLKVSNSIKTIKLVVR